MKKNYEIQDDKSLNVIEDGKNIEKYTEEEVLDAVIQGYEAAGFSSGERVINMYKYDDVIRDIFTSDPDDIVT